jgi:beta-phosphoglucomutase-like phosphatase (HAD superfamily)
MQTSNDVDLSRITTVLLAADGTLFPSDEQPRPDVLAALSELRQRYQLAVVGSSALTRLEASFTASGLDEILPPAVRFHVRLDARFQAEDDLPVPTGKPHPAVHEYAVRQLGITPTEALAVDDSVTGTGSAVSAGIATVGLVQFVPLEERADRVRDLSRAGATAVMDTWADLATLLLRPKLVGRPTPGTTPR